VERGTEPGARAAGIPEAMVHRPKWRIGLELYDIARGNGLAFSWVTFDEGYGGKPGFLGGLMERDQRFVGEVPGSMTGWIERPPVTSRPYHKGGKRSSPQGPEAGFGHSAGVESEGSICCPVARSWPNLGRSTT